MTDYRDSNNRQRGSRREAQDPRAYDKRNYRARNRDQGVAARANGEYRVRDRKANARQRAGQHSSSGRVARQGASADDVRQVQRERRGGASAAPVALPLPALLAVAIIVLALVVFGLSRCVMASSGGSGTGDEALMEESQPVSAESKYLPTPYIAEGGNGVMLHSAVRADQLTEILIHNASYSYADALTTQLNEATNTEVMAAGGTGRVADEMPTGDEWMKGEFIRCFRSGNAGPKMSAIDCGGPAGATVYAPVSGTVVRVKDYDLYNNPEHPDVQVHIQPEGRSDIDVVLIHLENVEVNEGDQVIGGVTPIAQIRDVYAYIGEEMQLKQYTAAGDNGNHTHIQINDATNKEYHGLD